jgi:hypothetical protein
MLGLTLTAAFAISACGSSDTTPTKIAVTASGGSSKERPTVEVPSSLKGGLVEVTLTNNGKARANAQFVRVDGDHGIDDIKKLLASDTTEIPEWIHGEGGPGDTDPGKTSTATMNLAEGNYFVWNDAGEGGTPVPVQTKVSGGSEGDLPSTDASVTAATNGEKNGEEQYKWEISGLKAGENTITFKSEGKDTLHHIQVAPVVGNATPEQIKKFLASNGEGGGKPPISFEGGAGTTVLDGDGAEDVTQLILAKPGKYAFVCFLTDKGEKNAKSHFEQGLLAIEDVK